MRAGDVSGLWKLTVLTSLLSLLPLCFLDLLPQNLLEQEDLGKSKERSRLGGFCFLAVLTVSISYSCITSICRVLNA